MIGTVSLGFELPFQLARPAVYGIKESVPATKIDGVPVKHRAAMDNSLRLKMPLQPAIGAPQSVKDPIRTAVIYKAAAAVYHRRRKKKIERVLHIFRDRFHRPKTLCAYLPFAVCAKFPL